MKNNSPNSTKKSSRRSDEGRRGSILQRLLSRIIVTVTTGRKDTRAKEAVEEDACSAIDTTVVVDGSGSFFLTDTFGDSEDKPSSLFLCTDEGNKEEESAAPAPAPAALFPNFADLTPDLKRRVASYLSTKDAYRLATTSQTTKMDLALTHRQLCPSFLVRKCGYRRQQYRFLQTIVTNHYHNHTNTGNPQGGGGDLNNNNLHSVHVHCRWTWEKNWQIPSVELLVVERFGYQRSRTNGCHISQRGRWATGGGLSSWVPGEEYGNEAFRSDQVVARCAAKYGDRLKEDAYLAMSFRPKKKTYAPHQSHYRHYYYELWFRCRRTSDVEYGSSSSFGGRYRQDYGPGFGEVVALEIFHNS